MEETKNIEMFAVLSRDGLVYTNREGKPYIFEKMKSAQREADQDGDSVVTVTVHLDREPLFVRRKPVPTTEG